VWWTYVRKVVVCIKPRKYASSPRRVAEICESKWGYGKVQIVCGSNSGYGDWIGRTAFC